MDKSTRYINSWTRLSVREKWFFCRAAISLIWIKAGLSFLPFTTFRKLYHWLTRSQMSAEMSENEIQEIVWAVNTAANVLPVQLLCLPRALATKFLMRKASSVTLEIGIEINPGKAFEAHAWVEKNGRIIIGDWSDSISYQRLWVWQ